MTLCIDAPGGGKYSFRYELYSMADLEFLTKVAKDSMRKARVAIPHWMPTSQDNDEGGWSSTTAIGRGLSKPASQREAFGVIHPLEGEDFVR